jgi:hypothetical protein
MALWMLGYPKAALADTEQALADAREIGQAATLMYALTHAAWIYLWRGDYKEVGNLAERVIPIAQEKGAMMWKGGCNAEQGLCIYTYQQFGGDTK